MRKSSIGLIVTAAFTALVITIKDEADRAAKKASKDEAAEQLDGPAIELAKEELKACADIRKAEKESLSDKIEAWEKEHKYRRGIKNVMADADREIRMLEINPDATENRQLVEVEERRKVALAASKKALGLAKAEKDRDKAVQEAKDKYEKQILQLNALSGGDNDLANIAGTLRYAAEKDRDKAVSEANKQFEAIKKKYDAKAEEWDEKVLNAKTVREEMLAEGRKHILARRDSRISALRKEHSEAENELREEIVSGRSEDEVYIFSRENSNRRLLDNWNKNLTATASDIYKSKTVVDKIGAFLMLKKMKPSTVLFVGCTPFVGIGLIAWEYWKFLYGIIKKMRGA